MSYTLEFEIKGLPSTANATLRGHWRTHYGKAKTWKRKVWLVVWHLRPPEPLTRAQLTLTRFSSSEPDFDGLVSSFKHVIDGLVEARVLIDDKPSVIGQPVCQWTKAKPGHGKIKVRVCA